MRKQSQGVSLIELMIALLIGSILLLGLVQVFGASRTAYQLSQGVARAQENGRFAIDYLQRDIRMLGHFGCVNDQARLQSAGSLSSHLAATDNPLNFNISLQGYDATATAPTASQPASSGFITILLHRRGGGRPSFLLISVGSIRRRLPAVTSSCCASLILTACQLPHWLPTA